MKKVISVFVLLALSLTGLLACKATPAPTLTPKPVTTPGTDVYPEQSSTPTQRQDNTGTNSSGIVDDNIGSIAAIPDFEEGRTVLESDVPDIKSALITKYSGATIEKISHGLYQGGQTYIVEYSLNGTRSTAYILPNGTIMDPLNEITP